LSSPDLRELSVSKRALVVTKKNGVIAANVDSDSDDYMGLQRKRPRNAFNSGRTASKPAIDLRVTRRRRYGLNLSHSKKRKIGTETG
jgi:hypothetical protein